MTDCPHTNLMVITENNNRLRCRHCHLTLKAEELENGYCPECLAESGQKRDDFEKIETPGQRIQYRCENCGAMLAPGGA